MEKRSDKFWRCGDYPFPPFVKSWMEERDQDKLTALDILKIRYAKGEISKEEFDKMKEDIS